jgi:hypothetical protein
MLSTGDTIINMKDNKECVVHLLHEKDGQVSFSSRVANIDKVVVFNQFEMNETLNIDEITVPARRRVS